MGSIPQKAPTETTEIKRPYDAAELRSLPREEQARQRQIYLKSWYAIRSCSNKSGREAAKEIGIPVRTLYEWKKKPVPESTRPHNFRKRKDPERYAELKDKVLDFRNERKSWGRHKIQYLMTVANFSISVAMVGRMLSELIKEGLVKSYYGTFAKPRRTTPLPPRPYAEDRPENLESTQPGGVVQFDTMFVKNPKTKKYLYHINAICCFTRISFSLVFDKLTAHNASLLLKKVIRTAPFQIKAVQTDRGSEFRGVFESTCEEKGIKLYINAARTPEQNGCIERFNRTTQDDFYKTKNPSVENLKDLNKKVNEFTKLYNDLRPHRSLGNLPPLKYLKQYREQTTLADFLIAQS